MFQFRKSTKEAVLWSSTCGSPLRFFAITWTRSDDSTNTPSTVGYKIDEIDTYQILRIFNIQIWGEISGLKHYISSIIYRSYHLFVISVVSAKFIERRICNRLELSKIHL